MKRTVLTSFMLIGLFFVSCGNAEESKTSGSTSTIKFDNEKDEMSYFYGLTRIENLENAQFYGELNKAMIINGFKENITIDSATVKTMNAQISKLIGERGQDFNAQYVDSGSFYLGKFDKYMLIVQLKEFGLEEFFNNKMVEKGFEDAINGKNAMSEARKTELREKVSDMVGKVYVEKQMKDGVAFLENNKKNNPKVKVTPSGLQYEVMKEGKGSKPNSTSKVKVHYHGTTPNGEVFDSSVKRGEPASFGLNQVIPGWTEGLQLMSTGAKYKFYIPQELAYGANPQPGSPIKPYMPLVFEVELLAIEK